MERDDTLPIIPESDETFGLFENIINNSSFKDRFDSDDVKDIWRSSDGQTENLHVMWNKLDQFNYASETYLDGSSDSALEESSIIPGKKVLHFGESLYMVEPNGNMLSPDDSEETKNLVIDDIQTISLPNTVLIPSLSLQPWNGDYNFSIGIETATHSNKKWAYSAILEKLFLRQFDAVPIEVKIEPWIPATINITPVFTTSQHTSYPVNRCHNHKTIDKEKNLPFSDHIVQVDNSNALYRLNGERHSVEIPLGTPAPGESSRLIYVKCGCWNTCTGGPDRKPFCLVFTLFNKAGEEIGRQILNLKVCACPVRDCGFSERKHLRKHSGKTSSKSLVRKKSNRPTSDGKRIKMEPCDQQNMVQISVPAEISGEIKKVINQLMAVKYVKENNLTLPFPDH